MASSTSKLKETPKNGLSRPVIAKVIQPPVIIINDDDDDDISDSDNDGLGKYGEGRILIPKTYFWTGETPFEDYSEDECSTGMVALSSKSLINKTEDNKRKKRHANRIEAEDTEEEICKKPAKKARLVVRLDKDDEDNELPDGTFIASSIPEGLLKSCSVVLERLSDEMISRLNRALPGDNSLKCTSESNAALPLVQKQMIAEVDKFEDMDLLKRRRIAKHLYEPIPASVPLPSVHSQEVAKTDDMNLFKRRQEILRDLEVQKRRIPSTRSDILGRGKGFTESTSNASASRRRNTCWRQTKKSKYNKGGQSRIDAESSIGSYPNDVLLKSILKASGTSDKPKKSVSFSKDGPKISYIEPRERKAEEILLHEEAGRRWSLASIGPQVVLNPEDEIISHLLKWNPEWFGQALTFLQENKFELPPIAENLQLLKASFSYGSVSAFIDVHKVLLLHELWEQLFRDYQANPFGNRPNFTCRIIRVNSIGVTFKEFLVVGVIHESNIQKLRVDSLLLFRLLTGRANDQHQQGPAFFGLITHMDMSRCRRADEIIPELRKYVTAENVKQFFLIDLTVKARSKTNLPTCEKWGPMVFEIVRDIAPMLRLMRVLVDIPQCPLQSMIMMPKTISRLPSPSIDNLHIKSGASIMYNVSQKAAISRFVQAVMNPGSVVGMLNGTAGSGKSQTIIGLIEEIQLVKSQSRTRGIVLVATPTKEASDQLSRRIISLNKFHRFRGADGQKFANFVRLGEKSTIPEDISRYCLTELAESHMRKSAAVARRDDGQDEYTERIAYLNGQLQAFTESQLSEEQMEHQKEIRNELNVLQECKRRNNQRYQRTQVNFSDRSRPKFVKQFLNSRRTLIQGADVIVCTLNNDTEDLDLLKEMHRKNEVTVICAIVDDADRAYELETLILAYHPMTKLFLFGSDEGPQLHAVSPIADQNGFGGSLFKRFLCNFEHSTSPVLTVRL